MKKIGILHGRENSFPPALVERVNAKGVKGIMAESVSIDKVVQGALNEYAVIIDRISQDVPFYRAYLKNAVIGGTAVINNPFWWSSDEKFFNNALCTRIDVPVPKTVLLPSHHRPDDTSADSFRNLKLPLDWEGIFEYIGWPAFMKPHAGGGWKHVYKLENEQEFFDAYHKTGQLVMMLQEAIDFNYYFRCYYLGGDRVHIMPYEPRNPFHERYLRDIPEYPEGLLDYVHELVLKINHALGYEFNTVELAVRDGIPYAIDFCNPAPDADLFSVGEANFEWIVENAANLAIERAQAQEPGEINLKWGSFVQESAGGIAEAPKKKKGGKKKTGKKKKTKAETLAAIKERAEEINFDRIGKANASEADDLKLISGVGPFIEEKLNSLGIYTFKQVAKFTEEDETKVNEAIEFFPGRIKRDKWAKQAKKLMK
ncbi:MAG: hypothetical protein AAGI38_11425 [Bacteroidota bacterium]